MIRAQFLPAILLTMFFLVLTGIMFPFAVWITGQAFFSYQANGSLIQSDGLIVGSELIGQKFSSRGYFHSRPSAVGYNATTSGGTNLGPTSRKLLEGQNDDLSTSELNESFVGIKSIAEQYRVDNGLSADTTPPADSIMYSASGLDPHISPENADLQVARIAEERGIRHQQILDLVGNLTEQRFLGIFGEPRVNVLKLNLALDRLSKH